LHHEIESLDRRIQRIGQKNRAGIIDEDIDAPESIYRLLNGCGDLFLGSNIHLDGERMSSGGFHFAGSGMDRSFEFGVWLVRFARDDNIRAFFSQPKTYGFTDTPAGAANKYSFIG
jgi:hypothetical protein